MTCHMSSLFLQILLDFPQPTLCIQTSSHAPTQNKLSETTSQQCMVDDEVQTDSLLSHFVQHLPV